MKGHNSPLRQFAASLFVGTAAAGATAIGGAAVTVPATGAIGVTPEPPP